MVGYTHHPIKSFCMSLYTNKYYLTYFFGSKEKESSKMYEWGGGQAHPSLEYISGLIMIGCGPGWIWLDTHTILFICPCSLTPASTEKVDSSKKWKTFKKRNQNTESPKTTRQDSPEKQQNKKKHKNGKKINQNLEFDKCWLFCVFLVCFFCVLWFCMS